MLASNSKKAFPVPEFTQESFTIPAINVVLLRHDLGAAPSPATAVRCSFSARIGLQRRILDNSTSRPWWRLKQNNLRDSMGGSLDGRELANAHVSPRRLKLLEIGAIIEPISVAPVSCFQTPTPISGYLPTPLPSWIQYNPPTRDVQSTRKSALALSPPRRSCSNHLARPARP